MKTGNGQLENSSIDPDKMLEDAERKTMPKLVIGLIRGELARGLETHFRTLGWRVCSADTSREVRAKACRGRASIVVLPVNSADCESGFLTCAKLVRSLPKGRVVLIGPDDEKYLNYARFVGAAGYVPDTTTPNELVRLLTPAKTNRVN